MKNLSTSLKRSLLLILSIVMLIPALTGFAATPKQKAMNSYKKWLSGSKICVLAKGTKTINEDTIYAGTPASKTQFAIAYINNDNIPEMIVQTKVGKNTYFGVFTYKNGKVTRLTDFDFFSTITKYYKKKALFVSEMPNFGYPNTNRYFYMHPSKTFEKFTVVTFKGGTKDCFENYMTRKGKSLSFKGLKTRIAAFTKGVRPTKVVYYTNTAANRNKILK